MTIYTIINLKFNKINSFMKLQFDKNLYLILQIK
jgi:hypothetical protein